MAQQKHHKQNLPLQHTYPLTVSGPNASIQLNLPHVPHKPPRAPPISRPPLPDPKTPFSIGVRRKQFTGGRRRHRSTRAQCSCSAASVATKDGCVSELTSPPLPPPILTYPEV